MKYFSILFIALLFSSCHRKGDQATVPGSWDEVVAAGTGSTVHMMMWQGDPFINTYMQQYVKPKLKELYGIELEISSGQGNMIVSLLLSELEAGKKQSSIDMMWINGETFYQLRQIDALYGPFSGILPNERYIDWDNPYIATDFQQPINGMECPWGNVQLSIIYDSLRTPEPPRTMTELLTYVQAHPGSFTIPNEFTGMTLLKSWLIAIAGGDSVLAGPFDEQKYQHYSAQLWEYIRALQPYMWKEGKTFPDGPATMHRMLANGEIDFSMSNNDGEVDNKVLQGILPETARSYVFTSGTIRNSHYLGLTQRSSNLPGAMMVINFLISPEAQFEKMQPAVWGDGTVLRTDELPDNWPQQFREIPGRKYAPDRASISRYALMELSPEYMIRLFDDFRNIIIEGR